MALKPKYKTKHAKAAERNATIALFVKLPQHKLIAAKLAAKNINPI